MVDIAGAELGVGDVVVADGLLAVVRDVYDSGVALSTYAIPGNGDMSFGCDAFHGCVWDVQRLPDSVQEAFRAGLQARAVEASARVLGLAS